MRTTRPERRERPADDAGEAQLTGAGNLKSSLSLPVPADLLADLDALAETLRGRLVVLVEIDEDRFRTHVYRSTAAAERCVQRARERGKRSHVTLVQMLPVGVVVGLGGGGR